MTFIEELTEIQEQTNAIQEATKDILAMQEPEEKTDPTFGFGIFMLGVEYGYKQCELGHNIQMAEEKARRLYLGEPKE